MQLVSPESTLLVVSMIIIAGIMLGKSSHRLGLPVLLIFLWVGMLFGTDGLGVQFSDMHTAQSVGMVALCIILFSGGMGTKISAIRPVIVPGLVLSTAGVLLTALLTGLFIWWLSGMGWSNIHFALLPSMLLAATMSSTDSASVFGILGSQKIGLKNNLRPMLELESGSNDPMAYMLTIILIETILHGNELSASDLIIKLSVQFGIGGLSGLAMGGLTKWLAKLYTRIGGGKQAEDMGQATAMLSILITACVFITFCAASALGGNGYLAVYICGIIVGNAVIPCRRGILKFMNGMTWLAQTIVFLMLGLLVNPHEMMTVAPVSLLIGAFMIVLGRPLSVFLCLAPLRKLTLKSKTFVSWVGLRGAVPIIFATYPVVAGIESASQIFNIVFFVTLLSLLIQGTTVISSAKMLNLTEKESLDSEDFGVEFSDEIPTTMHTVTLTDKNLENGNTLRSMNLPQGSLVMMIKRGQKYIVPNGTRKLMPGDTLLIVKEDGAPD